MSCFPSERVVKVVFKKKCSIINNDNVREAIVRAFRRDKNIIQQLAKHPQKQAFSKKKAAYLVIGSLDGLLDMGYGLLDIGER